MLCHTSISYDDIGERSIPQITAILERLNKHISIKLGVPLNGTAENVIDSDGSVNMEDIMFISSVVND